jgi:putative ABC transport system permease protein
MGNLLNSFAIVAVLIACLGLFGLASFMAEQRTREIGIRKVLGAPVSGIALMLSKEFTRCVLIANLLAWPAAYWALSKWLEEFAYRTEIGILTFVLSGLLALIIALLTVSHKSFKAAKANPVHALKYE